jgi:hypothetical protein
MYLAAGLAPRVRRPRSDAHFFTPMNTDEHRCEQSHSLHLLHLRSSVFIGVKKSPR